MALHAVAAGRELRIGVFTLFHPSALTLRAAPGGVLVVSVAGARWRLTDASEAGFRAGRLGVVCQAGSRTGTSEVVRVSGAGGRTPFVLSVPGKIERRFMGSLEIRIRAGELVPVIIEDLETAVESAVAAESAAETPLEALKAQAIAARSFYVASGARHSDYEFCDSTHCQFVKEPPDKNAAASVAASETKGRILIYAGSPVVALFSASCGGQTRTLAEAGMSAEQYPYYSVKCRTCRESAPEWQVSLPARYHEFLQDHTEGHRIALGRVLGWSVLPGYKYQISRDGEYLLVRGRGKGHGIGLCQRGAAAMSAAGASFRMILSNYYPNTAVVPAE